MEEISSRDNKLIKEYTKLSSSKSYRDKQMLYTLEGVKLAVEAFNNKQELEVVFVTQLCYEKHQSELEKLFQTVRLYIITEEISKKLTEQNSPQGIYVICKKVDKNLSLDKIYSSGRYIMLVDLQDSGNVGTIIRTAEAMGIDGIITTAKSCDIYNPKVIRGSMGSIFRMEFLNVTDTTEFISCLTQNNVKTYASVLDSDAVSLEQVNFSKPCVMLIGNEGNGLTGEVKALCSQRVTIKMSGNTESLNASMAACILMWEMTK